MNQGDGSGVIKTVGHDPFRLVRVLVVVLAVLQNGARTRTTTRTRTMVVRQFQSHPDRPANLAPTG